MKYKFKYLIVRKKPYNIGETITQINVSKLKKSEINSKWDEVEKIYNPEIYQTCLLETQHEFREL